MTIQSDLDEWLRRIRQADPGNFRQILEELLAWIAGRSPADLPELRAWLSRALDEVRAGRLKPEVLEPFAAGLADPHQDPEAAPLIGELMLLAEGSVPEDLAETLGEMGEAATGAMSQLIQLVRRRDPDNSWARAKGAWALGQIGGLEAVDALAEALTDPSSSVRLHALESLGTVSGEKALPHVRALAQHDPDPQVRSEAERVLAGWESTNKPDNV